MPSEQASQAGAKPRVLVVDDSATVRVCLQSILRHRWDVVVACDGPQGLAAYMTHAPFDVILVDYELPGFDGLDLARRIRRLPWGQAVPFVVLSTRHEPALLARAAQIPVAVYLKKAQLHEAHTIEHALSAAIRGATGAAEVEPTAPASGH